MYVSGFQNPVKSINSLSLDIMTQIK